MGSPRPIPNKTLEKFRTLKFLYQIKIHNHKSFYRPHSPFSILMLNSNPDLFPKLIKNWKSKRNYKKIFKSINKTPSWRSSGLSILDCASSWSMVQPHFAPNFGGRKSEDDCRKNPNECNNNGIHFHSELKMKYTFIGRLVFVSYF